MEVFHAVYMVKKEMNVKQLVYDYIEHPVRLRPPLGQYLKENGITRKAYNQLEAEYKKEKVRQKRQEKADLPPSELSDDEQEENVLDTLYELATNGKKVKAAETWLKGKGRWVEKKEIGVTVDVISGDERARREFEAERKAREHGRLLGLGVEDMPEELPLLLPEVREGQ